MNRDDVIELSVRDLAEAPELLHDAHPLTFAVRAQLVELLDEGTFEEFEALSTSVITTVYNLEAELLHMRGDLLEARLKAEQTATAARQVYVALLELESRLLHCGVPVPPSQYGSPEFPD